jgi:hypothetical protein
LLSIYLILYYATQAQHVVIGSAYEENKTQDEPVDKDGSRTVSQLSAKARPNCKDTDPEERSNEEAIGKIHESSAYGRSSEYECCKAI